MSNIYLELKAKRQEEIDNFPIGFAFTDSQVPDMLERCGTTDTKDLVSLGGGGYIHKDKLRDWNDMQIRHELQHTKLINESKGRTDGGYLYEAVKYELGNHEYIITHETQDALNAIGLSLEEAYGDVLIAQTVDAAVRDYLEHMEQGG